MTKRVPILCALVLLAAGSVAAVDRVVEATVLDVAGPVLTVGVYNPDSTATTLRVQASVLTGDGEEILTSGNVVVPPGATSYVTLTAGSAILGLGDEPEPIGPSL